MKSKYVYRISKLYRFVFLFIFGFLMLGEYGVFIESFNYDGGFVEPFFTIVFFIVTPVLIFSPYRDGYIELSETQLVIPSLFIPSFNKRVIKYSDIFSVDDMSTGDGYAKLTLRLKSGKATINSHFCYDKTILTHGSPDEYYDLHHMLVHKKLDMECSETGTNWRFLIVFAIIAFLFSVIFIK